MPGRRGQQSTGRPPRRGEPTLTWPRLDPAGSTIGSRIIPQGNALRVMLIQPELVGVVDALHHVGELALEQRLARILRTMRSASGGQSSLALR